MYVHVRWVTYYHGIAHPQVEDGVDVFHIWRVAANIFYKQSRTADKGCSSSLRAESELITRHCKKISLLQNVKKGLGIQQILWINDLSSGKWARDLAYGMTELCIGQVC
jgi:hypothetical protein